MAAGVIDASTGNARVRGINDWDVKDVTWLDENRVKWTGQSTTSFVQEDTDVCTGRSKPRKLSLVDDTSKWTPPDYFVP